MTTALDSSIGLKKETSFAEAAVPDHFFEFISEDFSWNPTFNQSTAQRYGRRVDAGDRRVLVKSEANGSLEVDMLAKGLGALFEAALGSASSAVASAPAYQQLIVPSSGNDFLPSYTIQKGIPMLGGGINPQTFKGCVCSGFELTVGNSGIPSLKFNWLGQDVDTSTAFQVPSYIASNQELSFVNGAIVLGGTLTVPTATALGSSTGTPAADIRDINFTWDNGLDGGGFNIGGKGKRTRPPALGLRSGKGTLTAEYDNNTLRDAFLNQTDLALVLTFQAAQPIITTYYPTVQIVIPNIRLEGELPKANGGDVVTQSVGYTLLDNRTATQPLYVAIVTTETAI